ncbi:hypothetical protein HaLaN_28915 [Haematococcus lacustris]|uniref:Uncharacterized protein n=1 Tax=Haematococcus lacustris TaxID=44745 RepID=A0A6A0ADF3_HAELA|nr:hypothetical protein HaLaN_28915 [Haematococcus lacustris]
MFIQYSPFAKVTLIIGCPWPTSTASTLGCHCLSAGDSGVDNNTCCFGDGCTWRRPPCLQHAGNSICARLRCWVKLPVAVSLTTKPGQRPASK